MTPDVAIVGGGLTGVSTALHLAKLGIHGVVFEAGLIADGASGRTGGLVLEGTAVGPLEGVEDCVPRLKRLVDEEHIECDLHLPGCWEITHRKNSRDRSLPWSDNGLPVSIAKTVSGGVVQPAALTIGIAKAALRTGSLICERSPVTQIVLEPELTLQVDGRRFKPGHIVVATNAWINSTLPGSPPLHSSLTFACATESLEASTLAAIGLDEGVPFYTADLPYLWGRTMDDGRVIFGSGLVFGEPSDLDKSDVRSGDSREALDRLQSRVRALHPVLAKIGFSAVWGGPIAFTDQTIPLLGPHPSNPRVLVAGAYAGHGVALSVRAGELMALAIARNHPLPKWGALTR
jgi:gamma-glutamylputrescine oxidase